MRSVRYHLLPPVNADPRNLNIILAMCLFAVVVYFAVRPELSVLGGILRILIASVSMLLSIASAMSLHDRVVFILNIFLALVFYSLFTMVFAVRIFGIGEWYISEIFEVTLFDVIITGLFGSLFYGNALRASMDLFGPRI